MTDDEGELILAKIFGAIEEPSIQQLTIYIPNKDKNGKQIKDLNGWIKRAQEILTLIGGGSTALPPADGSWLNTENDEIIREKTTIIYTYIDPVRFEENVNSLKKFLHDFGRETKQGEVVIEFYGRFYKIRKFDSR